MMIVVMLYVLSGTTNTQTGTHKETGAQPDPLLRSVSANSEGGEHKNNICFSEVNFLLVGALMNIGRQNKFLLIEPSALEHKLV